MQIIRAALLASLLAASARAAPAPVWREPRHVPSPQQVMERLRGEGFDVCGLKHERGDRWTLDHVTVWTAPMRSFNVKRVIVAPGDPVGELRRGPLILQPK